MDQRALEKGILEALTGALGRLVIDQAALADASRRLTLEIERGLRSDDRGRTFAPDQFTLTFHPGQIALFASQLTQAQSELAESLSKCLTDQGLTLVRPPHVTLASDPTLTSREIRAISWHSGDPLTFSALMDTPADAADMPPKGAFLMIGGKRHFQLTEPVVRIGRRLDNQLVLDDPHVSRSHAQLRAQRGHYVIVDLNSTAGTRVNGAIIRQHALRPGDVITISGIDLIYGEDQAGQPGSTPPYAPPFAPPSDRDRITPLNLRFAQDHKFPKRDVPERPDTDKPKP